jgi:hypothetical protein
MEWTFIEILIWYYRLGLKYTRPCQLKACLFKLYWVIESLCSYWSTFRRRGAASEHRPNLAIWRGRRYSPSLPAVEQNIPLYLKSALSFKQNTSAGGYPSGRRRFSHPHRSVFHPLGTLRTAKIEKRKRWSYVLREDCATDRDNLELHLGITACLFAEDVGKFLRGTDEIR